MRARFLLFVVVVTLNFSGAFALQDTPPPGFQEKTRAILDTVKRGEVTENITSASDPEQSYAVYLPSDYKLSRKWPALFLMDPRGRARVPLDRFVEVAERRGYILVSSYNTASDTSADGNTPALRAMLTDANYMFSINSTRFYLAGFSGTARVAWISGFPAWAKCRRDHRLRWRVPWRLPTATKDALRLLRSSRLD